MVSTKRGARQTAETRATRKRRTAAVSWTGTCSEFMDSACLNRFLAHLPGREGESGADCRQAVRIVQGKVVLSQLANALARQAAAQAEGPTAYRTCPGCQPPLVCPDTKEC